MQTLYKTQLRELKEELEEKIKHYTDLENDHKHLESERQSISAQLQLALAKADSEQLARSIADEQLLDVEKAKTMLELQMKDMLQRHKSELSKKDNVIASLEDSNTKVTVVLEDTKKDKEEINSKLQQLGQGRCSLICL